jgi:hypothetical protein
MQRRNNRFAAGTNTDPIVMVIDSAVSRSSIYHHMKSTVLRAVAFGVFLGVGCIVLGNTQGRLMGQAALRQGPEAQSASSLERNMADRLSSWRRYYLLWMVTQYALGIGSIVSSVLVALLKADHSRARPKFVLAATSAVLTALLTFLKPGEVKHAYHSAWQTLEAETIRYRSGLASSPKEDLFRAYQAGEEILKDR